MEQPRGSLRTELLVNLGFVTSAAVILVGVNTVLLLGGDLREAWRPLAVLWVSSMLVFLCFGWYLVHRLVIRPLRQLAAEADTLSGGLLPPEPARYETRELDELAGRYRGMAEELLDVQSHMVRVEKLAGIGRLAAGVAHEIRNPLGALGTYSEVLRRRGSDPAVVAEMHTAIARIDRIVQGLLDYARPGQADANGRDSLAGADLNAVVRTAVDFLGAQGMLRVETLDLGLAPDVGTVRGEPHGLEQVVINLLINAAHAAPAGRLSVGTVRRRFEPRHAAERRAGADGGSMGNGRRSWAPRPRRLDLERGTAGAILYVADDGPGVPDADRDRIFDPFFTTKSPGEGTGLGLAIVARTVHEAGGVVWVDRAREGGAVFKVFLPLVGATDACADR
jgi:two-component system, NtrC family, sensor kinase